MPPASHPLLRFAPPHPHPPPRVDILAQMIFHLLFLTIFCVAIFIRLDLEQPYRMQYAFKEVTLNLELNPLSNVRFNDIMNVEQVYDFAKNVLVENIYVRSWYSNRGYPGAVDENEPEQDPYFPYFFGDSSMTMGAMRVRQVRVKGSPCTEVNSTSFLSIMGDCYPSYKIGVTDDRGGFVTEGGDWYPFRNDTDLNDDPKWQSPVTLTVYGEGGDVEDLPVGKTKARDKLDQLKR